VIAHGLNECLRQRIQANTKDLVYCLYRVTPPNACSLEPLRVKSPAVACRLGIEWSRELSKTYLRPISIEASCEDIIMAKALSLKLDEAIIRKQKRFANF
jgi:hypothetical protein